VPKPPPGFSDAEKRFIERMEMLGFHLVGVEPIRSVSAPPEQLPEPQTALLTDGSR